MDVRRLDCEAVVVQLRVSIQRLRAALRWLHENNPLYKNVKYDRLIERITKTIEKSGVPLEEDSDQVAASPAPAFRPHTL